MPVQSPVANLRRQTSLIFAKFPPWPSTCQHRRSRRWGRPREQDRRRRTSRLRSSWHLGDQVWSHRDITLLSTSLKHHFLTLTWRDLQPAHQSELLLALKIPPWIEVCVLVLKSLCGWTKWSRIWIFRRERLKISPSWLQRLTRRNLPPDKTKSIVYNYEGSRVRNQSRFQFCSLLYLAKKNSYPFTLF